MRIDPGHDLVTQIRMIAPGGGRVQKLTAAQRGPAINPHHDAGWCLASSKQLISQFWKILSERRTIAPHIKLPRQPLNHINRGITSLRLLIISWRYIYPQRPLIWIVQWITLKHLTAKNNFVITSTNAC